MKFMKRKFNYKLKTALRGGAIALSLTNCSLIGVGFSDWIFNDNVNSKDADIIVTTGEVEISLASEYFNNIKYKMFTIGEDGIIDNDIIATSSTFYFSFNIITQKAITDYGANFNFDFALYCSNSELLNKISFSSLSSGSANEKSSSQNYIVRTATISLSGTNNITITSNYTISGSKSDFTSFLGDAKPQFKFILGFNLNV